MATTPKIPPLPKTAPPSTPDEMVRLDNQIQNKEPPKALQSLVSSDSVVILDAGTNFTPDKAFKRIDVGRDFSAWNFNPGRKVIRGLPGKANGRLSREEVLNIVRQTDVKPIARTASRQFQDPRLGGRSPSSVLVATVA
jgi:hypothetical protein